MAQRLTRGYRHSRRRGRAVHSASLQGIADLKAFRLVREGSDTQRVECAEIADFHSLDLRLYSRKALRLRDLLPQGLGLCFRAAGGKLEAIATRAALRGLRLCGSLGFRGAIEEARPTALAFAFARPWRGLLSLGGGRPARACRSGGGLRCRSWSLGSRLWGRCG